MLAMVGMVTGMQGDKIGIKQLMQEMVRFNKIDESNQIVQSVPRTKSNPRRANVQCYNCNAREENDFMLNNAYGNETLEELTAAVIMIARIQPADDNVETEPKYDAEVVSEVNASHIDLISSMISKEVHEHMNHEKLKIVINTSDGDQIDCNIIFDDPYVKNNNGTVHMIQQKELLQKELETCKECVKTLEFKSAQISKYKETCDDLEGEIRADKDTIERILKEKGKVERDFFKSENEKVIIQYETQLAKKAFKASKNTYLEDIVDLNDKLSSHDRIIYKMGQSIQTIHMLGKRPKKVYDPFLKARLEKKNEILMLEKEKISSDSKDIQANLLKRIKILENDFKRSQAQTTRAQHQRKVNELIENFNQKTYAYGDVHSQNQDLLMTISELKDKLKTIEKGKNVNTKFEKSETLGKLLCVTPLKTNTTVKAKKVSNSEGEKSLIHFPVAARSRNLGATSIVANSRFSVAKTRTTTNKVIQLVFWIVDSGCSKHMISDHKLLRNFIEKFMGTVRFGNDHFIANTGYGDYVQGNITICHVYYVEGLRHNLFLVRQFCDGDLEVAFHSNTCYVRNLKGEDLLIGSRNSNLYIISISDLAAVCLMSKATSTKSLLWHRRLDHLNFGTINHLTKIDLVDGLPKFNYDKDHLCLACEQGKSKKASFPPKLVPKKPNVQYFYMFGSLCYPTNDRDDLEKMKPKAEIGIFIGYFESSRGFRIYNCRTKKMMESIHVKFDELTTMASESNNSRPGFNYSNFQDSLEYSQSIPSKEDLDNLFSPLYKEYYATRTPKVSDDSAENTLDNKDTPSSSLIIVEEDEAPQIVTSSEEPIANQATTPVSTENANEQDQEDVATFDKNEFYITFHSPMLEEVESSLTFQDLSNMHEFYQPHHSTDKWTKIHPNEQVLSDPSKPIMTRCRLHTYAEMCMYSLTVSITEPKNIKDAMLDHSWIESMQEELNQFKRLDVWELLNVLDVEGGGFERTVCLDSSLRSGEEIVGRWKKREGRHVLEQRNGAI
ncbi:integrase, catalytic region, zinc finger, CCHC-type containing protein [Tanacetum coccineum]